MHPATTEAGPVCPLSCPLCTVTHCPLGAVGSRKNQHLWALRAGGARLGQAPGEAAWGVAAKGLWEGGWQGRVPGRPSPPPGLQTLVRPQAPGGEWRGPLSRWGLASWTWRAGLCGEGRRLRPERRGACSSSRSSTDRDMGQRVLGRSGGQAHLPAGVCVAPGGMEPPRAPETLLNPERPGAQGAQGKQPGYFKT